MKKCIICRQEFDTEKLSDEHVIPDSLGGYYHIYSVCDMCNKHLGEKIDFDLISHKIMQLCRFLNKIRSRKGYIPNPFDGLGTIKGSDDLKVKIYLNENGDLDYKLVPGKITRTGENNYKLIVDKRDLAVADKIINRFCTKMNIDRNCLEIEQTTETQRPYIEYMWEIDTERFKLGLLKIAYEFATDVLPAYINDKESVTIGRILQTGTINNIESRTRFIGNGVDDRATKCMNFLRNLDENHHYIMLVSIENVGLQCYINLFNTMFIGVWLSNQFYKIKGDIIIGINDIDKHSFNIVNIDQYVLDNYERPNLQLYTEKNREITNYHIDNNGFVPLFYKSGNKAVDDINKVPSKNLKAKDLGDMENTVKTKVILKKNFYFKDKFGELHLLKYYTVEQKKKT